jgi:Flp pilus assembly protein CpaB
VKRSNRLLILLGLLIAISASLVAAAYVSSGSGGSGTDTGTLASPTPTSEPNVTVVCAKKGADIQVGTTITSDMVEACSVSISDRDKAGAGTFASVSDVIGKIAGETITKGSIIVASQDFYTNGAVVAGKSLSNSIKSGKVAVSIEVDQTNGVGTLIVPGDHVDVILSYYMEQMAISETLQSGGTGVASIQLAGGAALTSKMIFTNCRVLATLLPASLLTATEAAVPQPASSGPVATAVPSDDLVQFTGRHEYVIIEVTPEEAEVIRYAQRAEKQDPQNYIDLGLALRSSSDNGTDADLAAIPGKDGQPGGITATQLIAIYGVLPPDPLSTLPSALGAKVRW